MAKPGTKIYSTHVNVGMKPAIHQWEARLSSIRFLVSFGEKNRAVTRKLPT
jgi:hypothetical protein